MSGTLPFGYSRWFEVAHEYPHETHLPEQFPG